MYKLVDAWAWSWKSAVIVLHHMVLVHRLLSLLSSSIHAKFCSHRTDFLQWVQNCIANLQNCNASADSAELPRGKFSFEGVDKILFEEEDLSEQRYAEIGR